MKIPSRVRSHEQQASADVLTCVGDLENPVVGAEVTLKAGSQILSLIRCVLIFCLSCVTLTAMSLACVFSQEFVQIS